MITLADAIAIVKPHTDKTVAELRAVKLERALQRIYEISSDWCGQPTGNSMALEAVKAASVIGTIGLIAKEGLEP